MEGRIEDGPFWDPWVGCILTPSYHGENCLGNGEHPDVECCCDECNYYLLCFPDWEDMLKAKNETG